MQRSLQQPPIKHFFDNSGDDGDADHRCPRRQSRNCIDQEVQHAMCNFRWRIPGEPLLRHPTQIPNTLGHWPKEQETDRPNTNRIQPGPASIWTYNTTARHLSILGARLRLTYTPYQRKKCHDPELRPPSTNHQGQVVGDPSCLKIDIHQVRQDPCDTGPCQQSQHKRHNTRQRAKGPGASRATSQMPPRQSSKGCSSGATNHQPDPTTDHRSLSASIGLSRLYSRAGRTDAVTQHHDRPTNTPGHHRPQT